ncbi:uncharacterized protein LODBEIA_P18630 [Lodderomyces beijingensis]|uniref:Alcohol dehydrogenase-like N-terminal domain-containing protein n=1 Tax=Lodderomyces beijingensis TaxID=1775926 RepID=A0ABP0ZIE8_9ASCO
MSETQSTQDPSSEEAPRATTTNSTTAATEPTTTATMAATTDAPPDPPNYDQTEAESELSSSSPAKPVKAKKSVGFAPPPVEDLREHHANIKRKEEDELKSSSFHKIPPELAYLDKKKASTAVPKPIDQSPKLEKPNSRFRLADLPDLSKAKLFDVKDLSVQNKETELQFHYTTFNLPPSSDSVIVDVKYASLNSFDLSKINQYLLNLSNVKVGLGYEFAGEVQYVGSSMSKKFAVGDKVLGMLDPTSRRGALSTSQVMYPGSRDVLLKVSDEVLDQLDKIDINLTGILDHKEFKVGEEEEEEEEEEAVGEVASQTDKSSLNSKSMPPLAKLSSVSLLYNHSKQMLQHLDPGLTKANILINGADTDIGLTMVQIVLSQYQFDYLNLILVIREKSQKEMDQLLAYFEKKYYDPSRPKKVQCVSFDVVNDGLYFAGERVPTSYKKPDFFATEIINSLLISHDGELINEGNINDYKLDFFVDLIGCKKYFQSTSTKLHEIETLNFPYKQHTSSSIETLFQASSNIPFLARILKPKKYNSAVVSGCKFTLSNPSYNIDKLIDFAEQGVTNPWNKGWASGFLNNWTSYYYYEEIYLKIKRSWCEEALRMVLDNQLKFKIDHFVDWRKDYKKYIKELKENDGKVIFKVEDF